MRFISVDFPDPDGPIIATYSPFLTSNETPCSACSSSTPIWYVFQMSCIRISGRAASPSPLGFGPPFSSMNRYIRLVDARLGIAVGVALFLYLLLYDGAFFQSVEYAAR